MNQNLQYQYCPRCGALMSGGICPCCANNTASNFNNNYMGSNMNQNVNQNMNYSQNPYQNNLNMQQPKKKMSTGAIVGIILGSVGAFVLLVFILVFAIFALTGGVIGASFLAMEDLNQSSRYEYDSDTDYDFDSEDEEEDSEDEDIEEENIEENIEDEETIGEDQEFLYDDLLDIDGDGVGELVYDPGLEALSADCYEIITDYLRYDLSYTVEFMEYTNDSGEVIGYYPYVTGEKEFIEYLNLGFYTVVEGADELGQTYECDATSVPFVTYMDEEILSVIYKETYMFEDGYYFEDVLCFNINMETGEFIEPIMDTSDEFMDILENRCLEQSGADAAYLFDTYSHDELRSILAEDETATIAFYTPLGMELGITYDGYWCCATFKDYEAYVSYEEKTGEL